MGKQVEIRHQDPAIDSTRQYAKALDDAHPLRHLRDEFIIPSKADLKRNRLEKEASNGDSASEPCIYLCGNSLGLQPRRTAKFVQNYLDTWATKGVYGHFKSLEDSHSPAWVHADDTAAEGMARIVGVRPDEVAVMETLTANLHLLLASFYRPTKERYKIIIEKKAFPSDQYAVQSQILHHDFSPSEALIEIAPPSSESPYLPTAHILDTIDAHASSTAVLLLSGVQYYSGQFFDMEKITSFAQSRGIIVGWDLAHAAGNVPLKLHDWNVDFAAWCTYKYLNSGAGAIGALYVHERHGAVEETDGTNGSDSTAKKSKQSLKFRPRLSGWWGGDKDLRFRMESTFVPRPGAAGFQVSNPSALDTAAVLASMSVFKQTDMAALREKSLALTGYLQNMLMDRDASDEAGNEERPYEIITPLNHEERGAQLSVKLQPGLLATVMEVLEEHGVVVDERKPDVVRVAPAPLYNSFEDVWGFVQIFRKACKIALEARQKTNGVHDGDVNELSGKMAMIQTT